MKTFIFYSALNKEIVALVANSSKEAAIVLMGIIEDRTIKDDYILVTSVSNTYGSSTRFEIDQEKTLV